MTTPRIAAVDHPMTRLNIATGIPFDDFRAAFEREAPTFDPAPFAEIATNGGSWDDVKKLMASFAPHDLTIYACIDASPMMHLAGHTAQVVEYLLGNHTIAETMYRFDPNAMLYAPLRVLLFSDDAGDAVFGIDKPSTVFAGLNHPDIAATGVLLDQKVAGLLRAIGVEIGDDLALTPSAAGPAHHG